MKFARIMTTILAFLGIVVSSACISNSGTGLVMTSPHITDGGVMPAKYTCKDENISPELDWSGAPTNTKSYAMVMVDLDAPDGIFTHWTVYDMPISMILLPTRMSNLGKIIGGTKQGINDFGTIGYKGPCPPANETHRYKFTIYALDKKLDLDPEVDVAQLIEVMEPRILEQASLTVTYTAPTQ